MKFDAFFKILITGGVVLFLLTTVGLISIATQSSIGLLTGGVTTFPQATAFMSKQAVAMVSVLANPERLYGLRQASLPLPRRQHDRTEWQQWLQDNFNRVGLDYERFKPWLGNEIAVAVTALDYDRNPDNGTQPGYLVVAKVKKIELAQEFLDDFYGQHNVSNETYKGAKIVTDRNRLTPRSNLRASAIVGDFVLFANNPLILREAIHRAQAVSLNLEHSDYYRQAIAQVNRPHLAISYLDVPQTLAWLDSSSAEQTKGHLSAFLSLERRRLVVKTTLTEADDAATQIYKSLLDRTELGKIITLLPLEDNAYIDLKDNTSLLKTDTVAKLAIKELFPHLEAIAIENSDRQDEIARSKISFELDS